MRRAVLVPVLVLVALSVAAGCTGSSPEAGAPTGSASPSSAPTTPSSVPSPTPSPYDVSGLADTLRTALIVRDAFADRGVPEPNEDEPGLWRVTSVCDQPLGSDSDLVAAHQRVWSSDQIFVQTFGYGFEYTAGADVVSEVRANADDCESYSLDDEDVTRVVVGEHEMQRPAGLDGFFAYCETIEEAPDYHLCAAFLARANLVSAVITARAAGVEAVTADLEEAVPLAARALTRAAA